MVIPVLTVAKLQIVEDNCHEHIVYATSICEMIRGNVCDV